jgi:hypothetical protein
MISGRNLSIKQIRGLLDNKKLDTGYSYSEVDSTINDANFSNNNQYDKMIDKSISILRIAMTRLSDLILDMKEDDGDNSNWILYEVLMRHRIMLHQQIDQLIKQKYKKLKVYGQH